MKQVWAVSAPDHPRGSGYPDFPAWLCSFYGNPNDRQEMKRLTDAFGYPLVFTPLEISKKGEKK